MDELLARVDDRWLWQIRQHARNELLGFVRSHLARNLAVHGASPADIEVAGSRLHPERLTLSFARRFASYKRPNLLLQDPERLARILNHRSCPVQLLVAGKTHPADRAGQALLTEWQRFAARPDIAGRVVFLEDYDMRIARHGARRGRLAEHAEAATGGQRHQRHEGAGQWRPEPVATRRLVGRSLRHRPRLGRWRRPRNTARSTMKWMPSSSISCWKPGSPHFLRP